MKRLIILSSSGLLILILLFAAYRIMFPKKEIYKSELKIPEGTKADSVIVFKEKRIMTLLRSGREIKTYAISLGKNPAGAKEKEGDKKTPEGNYVLDRRLEDSKYHLAIHISYPNELDKLNAQKSGVSPGGNIMIHGLPNRLEFLENYYTNTDWTDGCIAVTNEEIEEIWKLVDDGTPITIYP